MTVFEFTKTCSQNKGKKCRKNLFLVHAEAIYDMESPVKKTSRYYFLKNIKKRTREEPSTLGKKKLKDLRDFYFFSRSFKKVSRKFKYSF